MLTSTEACKELHRLVTQRVFLRYSNTSRPSRCAVAQPPRGDPPPAPGPPPWRHRLWEAGLAPWAHESQAVPAAATTAMVLRVR